MKPELQLLLERRAASDGVPKTRVVEKALRQYLSAPSAGEIHLFIDPRLATDFFNTAARLGCQPAQTLEALIRSHGPALTPFDIDPDLRRARAAEQAREALA